MKVEVNLLEQIEMLPSGTAGTNGKPGNSQGEFAALLKQNMAAEKAVEKPVQVAQSPDKPAPVSFSPVNRPLEKNAPLASSADSELFNLEEVMELIKPGGDPVVPGSAGKVGSFRYVDSDSELSAERAEMLKLIDKLIDTGQLKPGTENETGETGKNTGFNPGSAVNLSELNRFSEPKNEVPGYDMEKLKAALDAFKARGENSEEINSNRFKLHSDRLPKGESVESNRFSLSSHHLPQGEGRDESGLKLGSFREALAGRESSGADLSSKTSSGQDNTSKTIKGVQLQGQEQDLFGGQASIRSSDVLQPGKTAASHLDNLRENVMQQIEGRLTYIRENSTLPAEMRLTLNPPELGEVTIRVFSKNGQLSASIITESALVKEILESSITELRQRINFVNIQFEQLDISTSGEPAKGSDYSGDGGAGAGRYSDRSEDAAGSVPLENEQDISDGSSQYAAGDSGSGIDYWV